jgi:hypothetical protein
MVDCNKCEYAYFQEHGYSNYTVEGCIFSCLKGVHPDDGFDRWYGEGKRLKINCSEFREGTPAEIDVDREYATGAYDDLDLSSYFTAEQYDLYRLRFPNGFMDP